MKSVKDKVWSLPQNISHFQLENQMSRSVHSQIKALVKTRIRERVWDQTGCTLWRQIRKQAKPSSQD